MKIFTNKLLNYGWDTRQNDYQNISIIIRNADISILEQIHLRFLELSMMHSKKYTFDIINKGGF